MQTESGFFRLAKQTNIMLFSKAIGPKQWPALESFQLFHHELIASESIDKLQTTLQSLHINILIVELEEHRESIYGLLQKILARDNELILMTLLHQEVFDPVAINLSHRCFTSTISSQLLEKKLYASLKEVALFKHKEVLKSSHADEGELEVIYLCESLEKTSRAIDSGDLSEEVFESLKEDLAHIEVLFDEYMIRSRRIKSIIANFSSFVNNLDLEDVSFETFEGFDYLSRIVEDITVFLRQYFLERQFEDLYIIEDSLKNSVEFMRAKFMKLPPEKDKSHMEFFDD